MGGQKISRLYDRLGYWHHRFGGLLEGDLERRLGSHDGISVSQWYVLDMLYHRQANSISEIAAAYPIDQASASRLVARLEFKGLVSRKANPADPHSAKLKLTRKGRQLVPDLAAAADENEKVFYGPLSDAEIAQYKLLLAKLLEAHGKAPEIE